MENDNKNFFIELLYNQQLELAEIKPCCQENNVFYYDVYIRNQYQFTMTPSVDEKESLSWKIALKNADKHVDSDLVDAIGEQIEKHFFNSAFENN